jgi:CRP/FNR family transcriptional regulator, cyclic AMP receptor protein
MAHLSLSRDPIAFLNDSGVGYRLMQVNMRESFFLRGALASDVFYLLAGRAKLTVVSESGKEITVAMISAQQFFGEESASDEGGRRSTSATAISHCDAVRIERKEVLRLLGNESAFLQCFMGYLLVQCMRSQAALVDQLSSSSERRLARVLLLMAEATAPGGALTMIPEITQETLADMVGTTRSRVSKFMNEFRRRGVIDYKGRIWVHKRRLEAMLNE